MQETGAPLWGLLSLPLQRLLSEIQSRLVRPFFQLYRTLLLLVHVFACMHRGQDRRLQRSVRHVTLLLLLLRLDLVLGTATVATNHHFCAISREKNSQIVYTMLAQAALLLALTGLASARRCWSTCDEFTSILFFAALIGAVACLRLN